MSSEEREELASIYVLGTLEGDEVAAFERELTAHPVLAALVTELESASTILAMSVPQHKAPEVIRQSVFQQIRREVPAIEAPRRSAFSFGWIPWAIAAGLAVCCGLLWNDKSQLTAAVANVEGNSTDHAGCAAWRSGRREGNGALGPLSPRGCPLRHATRARAG